MKKIDFLKKFIEGAFLIIDVESIGLHGQGFAVAGILVNNLKIVREFVYSCHPDRANGTQPNRDWVKNNCAEIEVTETDPAEVCEAFWLEWEKAKSEYPDCCIVAECAWPVEGKFLMDCVAAAPSEREFKGPYPLHEIASILAAAGMDPMETYERGERELPNHHPLADARLSYRLMFEALNTLCGNANFANVASFASHRIITG